MPKKFLTFIATVATCLSWSPAVANDIKKDPPLTQVDSASLPRVFIKAYVDEDEKKQAVEAAKRDRRSLSDYAGKAIMDAVRDQSKAA